MKHISIAIALILALSGINGFSQEKGATALFNTSKASKTEKVKSAPSTETNRVSAIVKEKSKISYSVHSRGFIQNPKTGDVVAEIVTFRERGLWGNGCVTQLLLNDEGKPMAVLNSSASAGPGIALVQGASFVGGMYLFAEHLRPNNQNINSGNSGGGTTVNNSNSALGGQGGSGGLGGSATATGGQGGSASATGGSANNTISGGMGNGASQTVNVNSGNANGNGVISLGGQPVVNPTGP